MTSATRSVPDPGLFGPDSVSWRVHGDVSMALGGLRALLLQSLHPVALAGVIQNSDFRSDPWGRLMRTAEFVGTLTFGTSAEAAAAAARVRAIHRRVRGVEPVSGRRFRADDPDLLTWVHCCEVDSFLAAYRRSGGPLTAAQADQYVDEQRRAAEMVGLDARQVPASLQELAGYFRAVRGELRGDSEARRSALFVLNPPMPPWVAWLTPARAAWGGLGLTAAGLLPAWARRLYGLPGLPTTDLSAGVSARVLREGLQLLPRRYREGPHLVSARERLALS